LFKYLKIKSILKLILAVLVLASISGIFSGIFLLSLQWVTDLRIKNEKLIYFLPFAGIVILIIYDKISKKSQLGNLLIFNAYENNNFKIPTINSFLVYISTIISHLFGASVGREGTAIQMSTSLVDQILRIFQIDTIHKNTLIKCALAAGFSSVFGTPIAGLIFAFEIFRKKGLNLKVFPLVLLSSFLADFLCSYSLGVKHAHYPSVENLTIDFMLILKIILMSILFGFSAYLFINLISIQKKIFSKFNKYGVIIVGAIIIVAYYLVSESQYYLGLGIPQIQNSFSESVPIYSSLAKTISTTFSLAIGFKGGEVTPLFFIGSHLGSALSSILSIDIILACALGFVSVFGAATNTPFASAAIGCEIFGYEYFYLFLLATLIAKFFKGNKSIYS
jgi:H+/Cl- antiporter ClcA